MCRAFRTFLLLAVGILCAQAAAPAMAVIERYAANLDGFQTIPQPSPASGATGTMVVDINTVTQTFDIHIELLGLEGEYDPFFPLPSGTLSGTHIHLGTPVEASTMHIYDTFPALWVNEQGNNNPATGDWFYSATGQTLINEGVFTFDGFLNPGSYLNVHTRALEAPQGSGNRFFTGELRGQVQFIGIVPEPVSGAAMLMFAAMAAVRRTRGARSNS